jgi:cell division protein FtsQ
VRAALSSLEGRSLLSLNQGVVERRLAGLPDVARVTVNRDFPHTLRLLVAPAHSIAVLRRGSSAWIVSSDGEVIRAAGLFAAPKLPRIWVPRATSIDTGAPLEDADAARAVHALAVARGAGFGARIAAVRSSDRELTFVLAGGSELRFGDSTALPLKLAVVRRLLLMAESTGGYVDVTVPARPVAGRRNPKVTS